VNACDKHYWACFDENCERAACVERRMLPRIRQECEARGRRVGLEEAAILASQCTSIWSVASKIRELKESAK
jgi:hypothetical protein